MMTDDDARDARQKTPRFLCYPVGGRKRALMRAFLGHGDARWLMLSRLSLRPFPETREVAARATATALRQPHGPFTRRLKTMFLGWQYNGFRRLMARRPERIACVWNGLKGARRAFADAARHAGCPCLHFELGPLPRTLTVDPNGINAGNSLARAAAPYLAWAQGTGIARDHWRGLRRELKARTRKTGPTPQATAPGLDAPFIFAPLQVPGDTQLTIHGGAFPDVSAFVSALVAAAPFLPDGWHLRLKHHPSSARKFTSLVPANLLGTRIIVDDATDTFKQVATSRAVLTINSSVGLEGFFFDRPVIVAGRAFWGFAPIATPAPDADTLKQVLAAPEALSFDQAARDAFMNYLVTEYYPRVTENEGKPMIRASDFARKMATLTARPQSLPGRDAPDPNQGSHA